MSNVYDQHDKAFADVSAWVVTKGGERVATVARKTGGRKSPNGLTVYVYLHVLGLPMVRGIARGGGYSMTDAAFAAAAEKMKAPDGCDAEMLATASACNTYPEAGEHWDGWLRKRGYEVWQAV